MQSIAGERVTAIRERRGTSAQEAGEAERGDRVRRLRKLRGMTQQDLRRAAKLSLRTVKDVEAGHGSHRSETLHKIAAALRVRTSDLAAPGESEHQPVPGEPWEDVRDALYRRGPDPDPGEPATPAGVTASMTEALAPAWRAQEYSRSRLLLPGLVRDALALPPDGGEDERAARSRAMSAAAWLLTMTRQFEDGWTAARLALDAAPGLPDSLAAVVMMTWCLLRQGRSAEAAALAAGWADRAEPRFSRATATELAGYGKVLLMLANAMVTDNQPGEAQDVLSLARAAAARIGRDVPFSAASPSRFGPVTVQVITAEAAALSWQPGKALAIAERVRGSLPAIEPAQQLRHRLDVASAHAMRREYADVTGVMQGLAREAPEWLGSQQYARDVLEGIIRRRRGPLTGELRDLAAATRLPL
jgi:transcriptional regulator with XRE-family HTH domain